MAAYGIVPRLHRTFALKCLGLALVPVVNHVQIVSIGQYLTTWQNVSLALMMPAAFVGNGMADVK